ncbi:hypothetical protein NXH76_18585 [Blautia schinkii]|nr:hypothetical protein [Blautia schinkii]
MKNIMKHINMKYINRKKLIFITIFVLSISLLSGCGCGKKKDEDAAAQQVLKITITPAVTPTKAPSEVSKDAVVTNGNLTMVNEYLAEKEDGNSSSSDPNSQGADNTGTDGTGADSNGVDGDSTGGESDGSPDEDGQDDGSGSEE